MATKVIWWGTQGPYNYDDTDVYPDAITREASRTDGQHYVGEAPTIDEHVVRLVDIASGSIVGGSFKHEFIMGGF